jgi:hypothetical protein
LLNSATMKSSLLDVKAIILADSGAYGTHRTLT